MVVVKHRASWTMNSDIKGKGSNAKDVSLQSCVPGNTTKGQDFQGAKKNNKKIDYIH